MKPEDFGATELIVDCFGPLIDISKISDFSKVEFARYLGEEEIAEAMKVAYLSGQANGPDYVLKKTKDNLNHPKLSARLVDGRMVELLCRAKAFCQLIIVSTVRDNDLFDCAKKVLIEYSNQMIKYGALEFNDLIPLEENDFYHVDSESNMPGILCWYKKKKNKSEGVYRIAIDDASMPLNALTYLEESTFPFNKWIGGIQEDNLADKLRILLNKRKRTYQASKAIEEICAGDVITLPQYTIMDTYYVYSNELREQLKNRIEAIKTVLQNEKTSSKPICIFLAGTPGTGKSYFVKSFAKHLKSNTDYPVTSLSGVSSKRFYEAIQHHVEQVYNMKRSTKQSTEIAFLDEIDTKGEHFAFRFLMDAMTGTRTDEHGVAMNAFKSGSVENLIWFFAGSAGASRQEFIQNLKEGERKVTDFFDRIHFDMTLPSINDPGQVILTLFSAIKEFWGGKNLPNKISKSVLLAFACTEWTSTRSIMTICRVASSHVNETNKKITLDIFEDIDTSEEFAKHVKYIKNNIGDKGSIKIIWKQTKPRNKSKNNI